MRGRWSLAIVGRGPDPGGRPARPFHPDRRRHPDPGRPLQGRQGQHHERPALHPAQCHAADPRPRHPRRPRLHQFARDPGRLCHRIRPPRLRGARPRPDRPRLQRPARLRQRLRRPRWAGASAQPRHSSTRTISASRAIRWAAGPCWRPPPRCPTTTSRWCWRAPPPASRSPPTAPPAGRATSRWCSRNTRNSPP